MIFDNVNLNDELVFKQWAKSVADALNVEDVVNPALTNSWANVSGRTTKYYKHLNRVYIEGRIDSGTNGTSAFTLGEGYIPDESLRFVRIVGTGTLAYVDIDTSGNVVISSGTTSGISLDGISFRI